jgi:hypothetical protein
MIQKLWRQKERQPITAPTRNWRVSG